MMRYIRAGRRGAAAVTMVLVLVILHVAIVVGVVIGARGQEMTVHRLDAARAFYASEAGIQMALREIMTGLDEDGDGGVGTISDDGNSSTDPQLNGAAFAVVKPDPSGRVQSLGRSGASRRVQSISRSSASSGSSSKHLVYARWSEHDPKSRTWGGTEWGIAEAAPSFGSSLHWLVVAHSPVRSEVVIAGATNSMNLRMAVRSGGTWGSTAVATTSLNTLSTRPFWVACEQLSGRAVLVYGVGSSSTLCYRIWDGVSWSTANTTSTPLTDALAFIRLIPRQGANDMMLLLTDVSGGMAAMHWNGISFQDKIKLESNVTSTSHECVAAAWESLTGRCILVWGTSSAERPRTAVWSSTTGWSAVSNMAVLGSKPRWVRVVADPVSDSLMLGTLSENSRVHAARWNGSSWSAYTLIESSVPTTSTRCFDVVYEGTGTRALILYSRGSSSTPAYRLFDGTSWLAAANAPSAPTSPAIIQLAASAGSSDIYALTLHSSSNSLRSYRWNGSEFSAAQPIVDNANGGNSGEVFMMTDHLSGGGASGFRGWAEQSSQ